MIYYFCAVPVAPLRKEPSHRSEMTSQLLFGEHAERLEEEKEFIKVKCPFDGYEGWCARNQLLQTMDIHTTTNFILYYTDEVLLEGSGSMFIPFGAPVYPEPEGEYWFTVGQQNIKYITSAQWEIGEATFVPRMIKAAYSTYLQAPYLWGGKSVFGTDCSGFVQQVFKLFGVPLLRDAYQQATLGEAVNSLEEATVGDVAFFHNDQGRVVHVGILLEDKEIVHASGKVRIDRIDEKGIHNRETGGQSHHLHSIRRFKKLEEDQRLY